MAILGDYIRIKHGFAFKGDYITTEDNGVVLVTPGNFEIGGGFKEKKCKFFSAEYPVDYVLHAGDLIVTMTDLSKQGDTLGFSALVPNSNRTYLHNQRIGLVDVFNPEADKDYIYWFMRTPYYQKTIVATASGSTVKHTSPLRICDVKIELPPLDEQKKISSILRSIDDKIENNQKINDNLEQQIQGLFDTLFADKIARVDQLCHKLLGELVETIDNRGKTPPLEAAATDYPIIDVRALSGESRIIDYNNCTKYVSGSTYASWFRSDHPKQLDILISTVGSLAEMKMFFGTKGCIAQNVVGFRAKNISPYYLYQYLTTIKGDLVAYNIGSVQPSIKVTHIIKHPIYIPTEDEINQFDSFATSATDTIYKNNLESEYLANIRDTLLPKLMFGEIDVTGIQI